MSQGFSAAGQFLRGFDEPSDDDDEPDDDDEDEHGPLLGAKEGGEEGDRKAGLGERIGLAGRKDEKEKQEEKEKMEEEQRLAIEEAEGADLEPGDYQIHVQIIEVKDLM